MSREPLSPLETIEDDEVAACVDPEILKERREALLAAQQVMDEIERWAEHLLSEGNAVAATLAVHARQAFWVLIYYQAAEHAGLSQPPKLPQMSVREQKAFRKVRLP